MWTGEVHNVRKNGTRFWSTANVSTFDHAEYGEVWVSVDEDITERKQAEKALRASECRIRALLEAAVDGIITIDESGIIESVNPAVEHLFGYTGHELIGRNVKLLIPEPFHSEHDQYISDYFRTGESRIIGSGREIVGQNRDGTVFSIDLSVSEIHLDNRPLFLGIIRDATKRHQVEEERTRLIRELELKKRRDGTIHLHRFSRSQESADHNPRVPGFAGKRHGCGKHRADTG
jgi:PAS domain S-box-containing protein